MPPDSTPVAALPPLGGFFGLEAPGAGGMREHWAIRNDLAWENATSALAAMVRCVRPKSIWFPGYVCATILAAVSAPQRRFYRVTDGFEPDLSTLSEASAGDLVHALNAFGRAPGARWRDFVASHPDLTFVEDCAQTLESGTSPWGDWQLYSPRKLMGVPEGGILRAVTAKAQRCELCGPGLPADIQAVARRRAPMLARASAPFDITGWTALHGAAEASFGVTNRAMDAGAFDLLATQDPEPMVRARKSNFRQLSQRLAPLALFADTDPTFAPFGFPIRLPAMQRDAALQALYARRIFPAVHWRDLAAPPDFVQDHVLASSIVTLPCDHRYGPDDMDRLATAVLEVTR